MHEIVSNCGIIENCEQRANDSITCKVHLCLAFENAREIWSHHYLTKMKSLQMQECEKDLLIIPQGFKNNVRKVMKCIFYPIQIFWISKVYSLCHDVPARFPHEEGPICIIIKRQFCSHVHFATWSIFAVRWEEAQYYVSRWWPLLPYSEARGARDP